MTFRRPDRDPTRPVYVISVAASIVSVHPRTLRIYEEAGFICPARTPTNIRLSVTRTLDLLTEAEGRGASQRADLKGMTSPLLRSLRTRDARVRAGVTPRFRKPSSSPRPANA